jgi:hypothetical protein
MAKAGDELVNPVTGLRTLFRKTARETSGELLQVDWIGEPGWTTGPDHVHPLQEEHQYSATSCNTILEVDERGRVQV